MSEAGEAKGTSDRLDRAFLPHARVDQATLASLHGAVFDLKKRFVQREASWIELLTGASHQLGLFEALLASHAERGQQLTGFIGETCLLIGDVLFNRQDPMAAMRYYEMALRAAQESSNTVTLGRYSLLLIDAHQPHQALLLLEEALRQAVLNSSVVICSWLWCVKAEAHAKREEEKCSRSTLLLTHIINRSSALIVR